MSKFEKFAIALDALLREHDVLLSTGYDGALEVYDGYQGRHLENGDVEGPKQWPLFQ